MSYRSRAELVSKSMDSETYIETYRYRGIEYTIDENSEVPTEMQHYFEQVGIDSFIEFLKESSEEEFNKTMEVMFDE